MRRALDGLYRASGVLAAIFLAAIGVIVLLQVGANVIDAVAAWITGEAIGLVIPSYAEFAGFFLAASSFLALAYTLRHDAHVRVSLLLEHLSPRPRRLAEVWCTALGTLMSGYFAWYTVQLTAESVRYGDMSPGMIPVPLWLPQAAMALGLVVLTIALADRLVAAIAGKTTASGATATGDGEGV